MTPEEIQQARERCARAIDQHDWSQGGLPLWVQTCSTLLAHIASLEEQVRSLTAIDLMLEVLNKRCIASLEAERDDLCRRLDNATSQLQVIGTWFEDAKEDQEKYIAEQERLFPGTRATEYGRGGLNIILCGLHLLASLANGTWPQELPRR